MNIWVVKYSYVDIKGIVCATENLNIAINELILDADTNWGPDYYIQCWREGRLIGEIGANPFWCDSSDDIDAIETFKNIKEECKAFEIKED